MANDLSIRDQPDDKQKGNHFVVYVSHIDFLQY